MAEQIDELLNKSGMVKRLTTDIDELHEHIRTLENDKETVIMDKNKLNDQLRKLEEKMHGVQDLNQIVEDQNSNLQRKHSTKHLNGQTPSETVWEQEDKKAEADLQVGEKSLNEALNHIQLLKRELAGKDAEIRQMKAHISELNLHAEAQAMEYKQKFSNSNQRPSASSPGRLQKPIEISDKVCDRLSRFQCSCTSIPLSVQSEQKSRPSSKAQRHPITYKQRSLSPFPETKAFREARHEQKRPMSLLPILDRKPCWQSLIQKFQGCCESLVGKVEVIGRNEEAVEQNQAGVMCGRD
ncbi:hypothetical protein JHK86_027453 [Glycine max]|nr:hypothetical protein JHK86_027453 [Glycine max]